MPKRDTVVLGPREWAGIPANWFAVRDDGVIVACFKYRNHAEGFAAVLRGERYDGAVQLQQKTR